MSSQLNPKVIAATLTLAAGCAGAWAQPSDSFACIANISSASCTRAEAALSWAGSGSAASILNASNGGYSADLSRADAGFTAGSQASFDHGIQGAGLHARNAANRRGESLVATPVSEPSTYALMVAGLGLVGFMARRRRAPT